MHVLGTCMHNVKHTMYSKYMYNTCIIYIVHYVPKPNVHTPIPLYTIMYEQVQCKHANTCTLCCNASALRKAIDTRMRFVWRGGQMTECVIKEGALNVLE